MEVECIVVGNTTDKEKKHQSYIFPQRDISFNGSESGREHQTMNTKKDELKEGYQITHAGVFSDQNFQYINVETAKDKNAAQRNYRSYIHVDIKIMFRQ